MVHIVGEDSPAEHLSWFGPRVGEHGVAYVPRYWDRAAIWSPRLRTYLVSCDINRAFWSVQFEKSASKAAAGQLEVAHPSHIGVSYCLLIGSRSG